MVSVQLVDGAKESEDIGKLSRENSLTLNQSYLPAKSKPFSYTL